MFSEVILQKYFKSQDRRNHLLVIQPYKWSYVLFCNICGNGELYIWWEESYEYVVDFERNIVKLKHFLMCKPKDNNPLQPLTQLCGMFTVNIK